ncbi:MAG: Stp1/IreP family PP2C-type Ser/Thr phosphatase [Bacillota bacterium]
MEWSAKTSRGMVRPGNEDSWTVQSLPDGWWLAIVADGMGGNDGGEIASSLAVKYCTEYVVQNRGKESPEELLNNALGYGNRKVFEAAAGEEGFQGMGTTLTGTLVSEEEGLLYVGHVGDSRAYVASSSGIKQITDDHSITGELLRNGTITEEDAMRHPSKNILTAALGTQHSLRAAGYRVDLGKGDVVVLCTDGLTGLVSSKEIEKLLRERSRDEVAKDLVDVANDRGGYDNVTVVLLWPEVTVAQGAKKRW